MTPIKRYFVLNEAIKASRKQDFDIHIKGIDELNLLHDTVMLEGCTRIGRRVLGAGRRPGSDCTLEIAHLELRTVVLKFRVQCCIL